MIYVTCNKLLESNNLKEDLLEYLSSDLLNELYFKPKKLSKDLIALKLKDSNYLNKVINTINFYKDFDIEKLIAEEINNYENDTQYKLNNYKIYVIIGLDTTTIYSIKYNNEDVTVLLLESTNGIMDNLKMLLAHEFTHFVRREIFKRDIFENSIGERMIVEGIGCNYSREIVPNKKDYEYCIVNSDTVNWVKNNINVLENKMSGKQNTNELMSDFFYMYADISIPVRTGYVYGYLKVKEYLEKNNLRIKDILNKNWQDILYEE